MWLIKEKQWAIEIAFDGGPVDTADTSYRAAIINKFKEWKKIMFKKIKGRCDNNDLPSGKYQ